MATSDSPQFKNYKGEVVDPYSHLSGGKDDGYPRAEFKFDRNNEDHVKLLKGTDYSPKGQAAHESLSIGSNGTFSISAEGPREKPSGKGYAKSGARKPREEKTTKAVETPVEAPKKKTTKAPAKKAVAPAKKAVPYWKGSSSADMTPEAKEAWKKKNGLA
jgi:hypothetical protein